MANNAKQNSVDEQPDLPLEEHQEDAQLQQQVLDDFHPASPRPSHLTTTTTTTSTSPNNVSIIINPMQQQQENRTSSNGSNTVQQPENSNTSRCPPGGEGASEPCPGVGSSQQGTGAGTSCAAVPSEVMVINVDCGSPGGTESPGTSQMSPPPSYHDIPGTVPVHQGVSRGPPPSYEDAVDPNAPPPSYDSLFGRIRDTHKTSRNFIDFLVKLLMLLLGTIGCTIACSITIVIPVCMIVVGAIYFDECPAEPHIPVFLIVGGSFSVFKYLIGVMTRVRHGNGDTDNNPEQADKSHPAQSLITCFLCGWFITGCVWVYRIYKPLMEPEHAGQPDYCHRTVYIFAFWLITTAYIFLGLFTSCICCFSIVSVILKREY